MVNDLHFYRSVPIYFYSITCLIIPNNVTGTMESLVIWVLQYVQHVQGMYKNIQEILNMVKYSVLKDSVLQHFLQNGGIWA